MRGSGSRGGGRNKGVYYKPSEKSKSDIYVYLLPLFNSWRWLYSITTSFSSN